MRSNKKGFTCRCGYPDCEVTLDIRSEYIPRTTDKNCHIRQEMDLWYETQFQESQERCQECNCELDVDLDYRKPNYARCEDCSTWGLR